MSVRAYGFGLGVIAAGAGLLVLADRLTPPRTTSAPEQPAAIVQTPATPAPAAPAPPPADAADWRIAAAAALTDWVGRAGLTGLTIDKPPSVHEFDQAWNDVGFVLSGIHGALRLEKADTAAAAVQTVASEIGKHCAAPPTIAPEPVAAGSRASFDCTIDGNPRLFLLIATPAASGHYVLSLFGRADSDDVAKARALGDKLAATGK